MNIYYNKRAQLNTSEVQNMSIQGLGPHKKPFVYLDEFVNQPDWERLHPEVCYGISQARWDKKFVSSGVHREWASKEITPYLATAKKQMTPYEFELFEKCKDIESKIKYGLALSNTPHPFWVLVLRDNKRVEFSGVGNKAKGEDCFWTDNAEHFPTLVEFIKTLPFKEIGRVIFFMTEPNNQLVPHIDSYTGYDRPNDDFIWFTTKPSTKTVFVMDGDTKEKHYQESGKRFIWFNEFDYHGTDPVSHFSFSIRVDGVFNDDVKNAILV